MWFSLELTFSISPMQMNWIFVLLLLLYLYFILWYFFECAKLNETNAFWFEWIPRKRWEKWQQKTPKQLFMIKVSREKYVLIWLIRYWSINLKVIEWRSSFLMGLNTQKKADSSRKSELCALLKIFKIIKKRRYESNNLCVWPKIRNINRFQNVIDVDRKFIAQVKGLKRSSVHPSICLCRDLFSQVQVGHCQRKFFFFVSPRTKTYILSIRTPLPMVIKAVKRSWWFYILVQETQHPLKILQTNLRIPHCKCSAKELHVWHWLLFWLAQNY